MKPVIGHVVPLSGVGQPASGKKRLLGIDSGGLEVLVVPEDHAGRMGGILNDRGVECEVYVCVGLLPTIVICGRLNAFSKHYRL